MFPTGGEKALVQWFLFPYHILHCELHVAHVHGPASFSTPQLGKLSSLSEILQVVSQED
jgi:hypothetical protein